jgi:ubiquinone/menaquinone biosynthesis C-methylase UbiE/GNAT superfamily N-acetyltransferase
MNIQQAYNTWADTYDDAPNKTRDLEAVALRSMMANTTFQRVLETGCGTGKNTEWLLERAQHLTAADFSAEMLQKAKDKIRAEHVDFIQMDLTQPWPFEPDTFDLIVCSLVLEHIENLDHIFQQAYRVLKTGGRFYIGEYHPFKQYLGKKARFDTGNGIFELTTYTHHVSEFVNTGTKNHFQCSALREWFDGDNTAEEPRILALIFEKQLPSVRIVDYTPQYAQDFKALNEAWISQYFVMEESDRKALSHPQEYYLDKGGHIFVALDGDDPVGVCALLKMEDPKYQYELSKMAVAPKAQGKRVGWLLAQAVIEKAISLNANYLYIESNTVLEPAIRLYRKLGFTEVYGRATPYERCNIQMELKLR